MNKILMLAACGSMACFFAPQTDEGSSSATDTPLLDGPSDQTDSSTAPAVEGAVAVSPDPDIAVETPAETDPAASAQPAARTATANARTQSRLDPTKKPAKTGARPRKAAPTAKKAGSTREIVGIVMQTSRVTGSDGRAIPRRTVALALAERAESLIERGWARAATEAETSSATIVLD